MSGTPRGAVPRAAGAGALLLALALAGCGGGGAQVIRDSAPQAPVPKAGAAPWPAPPDPLERTREAGLTPTARELLTFHAHAHLDLFVNGESVSLPAGIGIAIEDPGVERFDTPFGVGYGRIESCLDPCISPLHTHDASGVIHTEAAISQSNRLGQLFDEWGVRLDGSCVGGYPSFSRDSSIRGRRRIPRRSRGHRADGREGNRDRDRLATGGDPDDLRLLRGVTRPSCRCRHRAADTRTDTSETKLATS